MTDTNAIGMMGAVEKDEFLVQLDHFLSDKECRNLLQRANTVINDDIGNRSWHLPETGGKYMRVLMIDRPLADNLWDRVKSSVPHISGVAQYKGYKLLCLNDHFRFSRYNKGGYFPLHCDGKNYDNSRPELSEYSLESLFTLNIFLNDDFEGGATDFFNDSELRLSVKPQTGRAALFWADQYHQGNTVDIPYKYLLRTDVMGVRMYSEVEIDFKLKSMAVTHQKGPCEKLDFEPALTFPYEPDHFQKHAFNAMENKQHVLVTAHTGSGKTTVAEYSVALGIKSGKKIIYTSPIKALSNQIFGDFSRKYPDWSLGIRTGDIDFKSEEAQVVIMTTEILLNMLYQQSLESGSGSSSEHRSVPNIDFKDISMVIFDEVHYIKDHERGSVWERSIIMMPDHIQMVMLSATLPDADKFCQWIAECKGRDITHTTTPFRAIPLTHYVLTPNGKTKIMDKSGHFDTPTYTKAMKKFAFIPSQLDSYIKMFKLPALLFCFSKKHCQTYAHRIISPLVTPEEQREIHTKFEQLLRRFKDHKDIAAIKQTQDVQSLIVKGVCYHHAGLLPPLKEIIQELFSQGLVKVLFVTETFAAGVNMPAKTVVFTGFQKYDDHVNGFRTLLPEEYGQMAGRAGRRGMDTEGTVIHLPFNLNQHPSMMDIREMMCGKIRNIVSRIKPDYHHVFNSILYNVNLLSDKSLLHKQTSEALDHLIKETDTANQVYTQASERLSALISKETDEFLEKLQYYQSYHNGTLKGKPRKKYHNSDTEEWYQQNKRSADEISKLQETVDTLHKELQVLQNEQENLELEHTSDMNAVIEFLCANKYLSDVKPLDEYTPDNITIKGIMASGINEANPILLTELIMNDYLDDLDKRELIAVLAIFLRSKEMEREYVGPKKVMDRIRQIDTYAEEFSAAEWNFSACVSDWTMHMEFCDMAYLWTDTANVERVYAQSGSSIQVGEFVRMMIKLNNICRETMHAAQICHKDELCYKLQDSQELLIKGVAFPQSLYVSTSSSSTKNG
jgi:superfamily II RNA helicase